MSEHPNYYDFYLRVVAMFKPFIKHLEERLPSFHPSARIKVTEIPLQALPSVSSSRRKTYKMHHYINVYVYKAWLFPKRFLIQFQIIIKFLGQNGRMTKRESVEIKIIYPKNRAYKSYTNSQENKEKISKIVHELHELCPKIQSGLGLGWNKVRVR